MENFDPEPARPARTADLIGRIRCSLASDAIGDVSGMEANCFIDVLDTLGSIMSSHKYDVRIHGNAAVQAATVTFLDAVRAQAIAEILPQ